MINNFDIKPVLTTIKIPEANAPVERVHQVILNVLVTKDLSKKVFDYKYLWGETLAYIAWSIMSSYHRTIHNAPVQFVFYIYSIFNLASVIDWQVITTGKQ